MALQRCKVVNETLDKRPLETTQNATNFMNTLTQIDMQNLGIKDRVVIIIWERMIIGKHNHVKNVREKVEQMLLQVQSLKKLFQKLFENGLPSFWDDTKKLISQEQYHSLLV